MRGTTWGGVGGGVGWVDTLRHGAALYYDSLSLLIKTVSQLDNTENGESAASART